MKIRAFGLLALAATALVPLLGCGSSMPVTAPVVPATPVTDTLTGTIPCCFNSDFKTFTETQAGNVDITMTGLTLNGASSTISMILYVGTPTGTTCTVITGGAVSGPAGVSGTANIAELSGSLTAGTYCVDVTDFGNVPPNTTVAYTVTVSHT